MLHIIFGDASKKTNSQQKMRFLFFLVSFLLFVLLFSCPINGFDLVLVVGKLSASTARVVVDRGKLKELSNVRVKLFDSNNEVVQSHLIEFASAPDDAPVSFQFGELMPSTPYVGRFFIDESSFEDVTFTTLDVDDNRSGDFNVVYNDKKKQQFVFLSCSRVNEGNNS